jgi:acetylornithine deacetylase/succinyl-diaminopimelate desuccinylase-like protein
LRIVRVAPHQYDKRHGPAEHDFLGEPTLTATHIEGGGPLNQVPAKCTGSFDRRSVPPETIEGFLDSLESYLAQWLPADYGFEVSAAYPDSPSPNAFATDPDTDLVQTLAGASGGHIRPFGAATDASYFADNGPTVVFGPGVIADEEGPAVHSNREYIHRSEIVAASETVQNTIEQFF